MPELAAAEVSAAGSLEFTGFSGQRLELDLSAAGQLEGHSGRYDTVVLDVSAAGRVDLRDVPVVNADVDLSGAARVVLTMSGGVLTGSLSGAGTIEYYGTIREQRVDVSGVGRIMSVN
jgi:hypothetical protein